MAKSNALADFTRLPTQQKVLLFVVLGLLLGAIYYYVVFKSLDQRLADAQGEYDTKVALNKKLELDLPKFHDLQNKLPELDRLIKDNAKRLPTETELPAFFGTINRRLIESGVELVKTTNQKEQTLEGFVKVPIDIEVTGSYLQLKRFFASLAQNDLGSHDDSNNINADDRDRIISIENLELSQPTMRNGSMVLDAKFTAATFHLAEPVGSGSGSGAHPGAGAGAGSANAPTGAPLPQGAPLPPANTPAGAKARAEAGVQKGAERNANATGVDEAKTPSAAGSGSDRLKGGL